MQVALENIRKVVPEFPRSVLKRKAKVEEGGTLGLRAKKK